MSDPRITDNDSGEITATVNGKEVRGWSYTDDAERRTKMQMAHEFAEGWFQATRASSTEFICETCQEAAYDRQQESLMEGGGGPSLLEQQQAAYKIKHGLR